LKHVAHKQHRKKKRSRLNPAGKPAAVVDAVDSVDEVDDSSAAVSEVEPEEIPAAVDEDDSSSVASTIEPEAEPEPEEAPGALEPSEDSHAALPARERWLTTIAFGAVILLGAVLRFWNLGYKPLHHDESMHAYYSLQLMFDLESWSKCFTHVYVCYQYDPVLHGPFQFHAIAFVYWISQLVGVPGHGANSTTVRIAAATLGTLIVALPYLLRDYLGKIGAWLACFLLAVSPSMVYYSRFAREDIYMACFTILLVVAVARYLRERKMRWLVLAAAAFSLSYATKEATFLTVGVFGSFFGALIVWELGLRWPLHFSLSLSLSSKAPLNRISTQTAAPVLVLTYFLVLGVSAKIFLGWLKNLSIYITDPRNVAASNAFVQTLKDWTVAMVPWIGILLGIYVLSVLLREMLGRIRYPKDRRLARMVDPQRQPLLYTIATMPWTYWFFALLCGWAIFLLLFTVEFTNIRGGIGDGIWQGLYYWLQQQQVARGGQPWYYYLLLIPLYEQIGVVFGIVGIVRSVLRPTRFRLFLVYWCVGNIFIYSWAAEKMPWLTIHMTMPLMLLAAIGLEPAVLILIDLAKNWLARSSFMRVAGQHGEHEMGVALAGTGMSRFAKGSAIFGVIMAVLLLLPTVHNMYELTYVYPADAHYEMMIYVQTTTDVNTVMAKVNELDQRYYGGKHLLPIGVTYDADWPFYWYLRNYTNVCYNFPTPCPAFAQVAQVVIVGGDNLPAAQMQYSGTSQRPGPYLFHQYHMRTWWDQGYMPPLCVKSATNPCTDPQPYIGVGPWLWLSYGDNPPPGATFNLGLAAQRIWQWWWQRKPFGSTDGSYDMGLFIRKGLGVTP
jgi:uncharacterized protein (TIGR03663 family)